jgi:hypothetical protein
MNISANFNQVPISLPKKQEEAVSDDTKNAVALNLKCTYVPEVLIGADIHIVPEEEVRKRDSDEIDEWVRILDKHFFTPSNKASEVANTLYFETAKINEEIQEHVPEIKNDMWDFAFEDDKFIVESQSLSKHEKNWIELYLNRNTKMIDAAKQFNQAMVDLYQTNEQDEWRIKRSGVCEERTFKNVKEQLNGNVLFKEYIFSHQVKQTDGTMLYVTADAPDFLMPDIDTKV